MATIPASENEFPQILIAEGAAPGTPASGLVTAYAKADGLLYWKDDTGTERAVGQGDTAAHLADTSDAHDASAISFTPTGTIAATDVQAAIAEVASEAAAGVGSVTLITDILHGSDTASFDFTSIPGTYKHLQIILNGRSTRAANTSDFCTLRLNNDSGSNYDGFWMQVYNGFGVGSGNEWVAATSMTNFILVPAASSAAGSAAGCEILIPDYAATTFQKNVQMDGYVPMAQSSGNIRRQLSGGNWRSTAAVTRVTIAPANGNWLAGSRASLYGIS